MSGAVVCSVNWLVDHLAEPDVAVVDVRSAWEYETIGHVPGAVSIPFEEVRDSAGSDVGMLPGATRFGTLLSDAGIDPDDTLVAYDDEHGVFAARFLVTAIMYGHDDVRLLDGDYTAWSQQAETSTERPARNPTDYRATVPDDRPLVDADDVLEALSADDTVLLDTRNPDEFEAGHIQGAVNFDWREFVDPDSRGLKPGEERLDVLASVGISADTHVILYCNTARRISHTYLSLLDLGFDRVSFFEGSLTAWRERDLPLVSSG